MVQKFVSVIIPVYNNSGGLKKCLAAIENQTYPKNLYEVIVIDNGSTINISEVVSFFKHSIFVREDRRGSYRARNAGILRAKGKMIAFTDSDCIPFPDWIEKGAENILLTDNCGLVAGGIDIFFKNPEKPSISELFESITAFRQADYIKKLHFGVAANIFIPKAVFDKVGLFDSLLESGADLELGQRIFLAGYKQIYADDTRIAHPARSSLFKLCKKHIRIIRGLYDMRKKKGCTVKEVIKHMINDWPKFRDFSAIFSQKKAKGYMQKAGILFTMLSIKIVRLLKTIHLIITSRHKIWPDKSVVYYCGRAFEPRVPENSKISISGSQTPAIELANKWTKLGYKVYIYSNCGSEEGIYQGVNYVNYKKFNKREIFDTLIIRHHYNISILKYPIRAKTICADLRDIPGPKYFTRELIERVDKIFVGPEFARSFLPDVPESKFVYLVDGAAKSCFDLNCGNQ